MKTLFKVSFEITQFVMAEDEGEAIDVAEDATRDDFLFSDAAYAKEVTHKGIYEGGWDDNSLVYGADDDTTLAEAWAHLPEHPTVSKLKAMQKAAK